MKIQNVRFPLHDCSLSIVHNPNKTYYQSVQEYLDDELVSGECKPDWESERHRERAIELNDFWEMQWYPNTPICFNRIAAPTFAELIEFSLKFEGVKYNGSD